MLLSSHILSILLHMSLEFIRGLNLLRIGSCLTAHSRPMEPSNLTGWEPVKLQRDRPHHVELSCMSTWGIGHLLSDMLTMHSWSVFDGNISCIANIARTWCWRWNAPSQLPAPPGIERFRAISMYKQKAQNSKH